MDKSTSRKEPIRLSEINFMPIIIALLVVFFTLVVIYLIKKRAPKRTDILLTGLCDSGKTLLYSLLLNGNEEVETFTSLKENCGIINMKENKSLRLVDLPGHERLRLRLLDNYKNTTKGLVFVVDSSSIQKDIKDVADYLYTILADKSLASLSVLILCNKQDETMAKGMQAIESLLEKEINLIRKTRTSQLLSVDNSSDTAVFLGKSDKDFDFSQISQKISFGESSAKNNKIEQLISFMNDL